MSRIGKLPVTIPAGVNVNISGLDVTVKGPLGQLSRTFKGVMIAQKDSAIEVKPASGSRQDRAFWGLTRSLLNNMVLGVSSGFKRELQINGVGYRAEVKGNAVVFNLGHSHPIEFPMPEGVKIQVEKQTTVFVSGIDKQAVGQTAARIRALRPPEPYKGKGVKYAEETIRRKAGKAAK